MRLSHQSLRPLILLFITSHLISKAAASIGDRLPEFTACVSICIEDNCSRGSPSTLPLHLRLLSWTCPSNCDYTCQHIITDQRLSGQAPAVVGEAIVQYHGKWPFHRFMGMQEPFSVVFSFMNLMAHKEGMGRVRACISAEYPLRRYYIAFGYLGLASWTFSMIFHTRDFNVTEKLDYFAAGASVLYGLYYTPIRIFRMERQTAMRQSLLRIWTSACILMFIGHVAYLSFWSWDYTYNMAANVAVGVVQNVLWTGFSILSYKESKKSWAAWPGMIVAWIILAMSLELLDFAPIAGMVDAHSLWHLGTVVPTIWWYRFLIKDAQQDMVGSIRLKA